MPVVGAGDVLWCILLEKGAGSVKPCRIETRVPAGPLTMGAGDVLQDLFSREGYRSRRDQSLDRISYTRDGWYTVWLPISV